MPTNPLEDDTTTKSSGGVRERQTPLPSTTTIFETNSGRFYTNQETHQNWPRKKKRFSEAFVQKSHPTGLILFHWPF